MSGSRRGTALALAFCFGVTVPAFRPGATAPTGADDAPPSPAPAATIEDAFVAELIGRMTLEEKLGQLTQLGGGRDETGPSAGPGGEEEIRRGAVGSFLGVHGAALTHRLQRIAVEESRLGIPLAFAYDVLHGFRTLAPMPLAEAASWDLERIERSARLAAIEATAHGIHWTYAPMADVTRDPRWGRIVEGAGESAFLGAAVARARVHGFQGDDLAAPDTLLACVKHFAAYGHAEGGRDYDIADLSERTLHETYLPPFEAAVDAGVGCVMAAFNEVNGVPAHADRGLLRELLRERWGFDGLVVSDYTGIAELLAHGVARDRVHAGALAMAAGIDVDMVSRIYARELPAAVRAGRVPEAAVEAAVARVLRAKYRLGLFDDPYRYSDAERERTRTLGSAHRAFLRGLAADSIVLLANRRDTLPLAKEIGTLAVVGPLADERSAVLGGWAMRGRPEEAISVLDGIRAAVSPATRVLHAAGCDVRGTDTGGFADALAAAARADAVVLVVGEDPGLSSEANNRVSLDLPGVQRELAMALVASGKPLVAVLVNGRPLSIPWLDAHADAVVESWFLGNEAGHAVADVLFGDVNPSGKLPVSVPRSVGQVPIYHDHRSGGRPSDGGKPYTKRYVDSPATPLYPFGHGLGYSPFTYEAIRLNRATIDATQSLTVSARIRNAGERRGTEIVQLYVRDHVASRTRPVRELRGFRRVTLGPGESRRVRFVLRAADLAFRDADLARVAEAGAFSVFVAPSSVDGLEARFELVEDWRGPPR